MQQASAKMNITVYNNYIDKYMLILISCVL
jgi:hypothetical protein